MFTCDFQVASVPIEFLAIFRSWQHKENYFISYPLSLLYTDLKEFPAVIISCF